MNRGWRAFAAAVLLASPGGAQGTRSGEAWVGSELERYLRALSILAPSSDSAWMRDAFSPRPVDWCESSLPPNHPWQSRACAPQSAAWTILRPSVWTSFNTSFPWGFNDGAVWQGRGLSTWVTVGALQSLGRWSVRLEPLVAYAANTSFELNPVAGGADPLHDPVRPGTIDLPQRFGSTSSTILAAGQSFVRFDATHVAVVFGTESMRWGAGIEQPLFMGNNAAGFPHVSIRTTRPFRSRLGAFAGELLYGRLERSAWAPAVEYPARFAAGVRGSWTAPHAPIELGVNRFYHRAWQGIGPSSFLVPFGVLLTDHQNLDVPDNQLASAFIRVRAPRAGLEVFGEFGRNDRSYDLRDLGLQTELNSAWSLGFLHTTGDSSGRALWTTRAEFVNGRIAGIQRTGRLSATFYEHSRIAEGHTNFGQLLGSPLLERSGGLDAAVERWTSSGRVGLRIFERQMPLEIAESQARVDARTQWDVGVDATRFYGRSDVTVQAGIVTDLNRFRGRDVSSQYLRVGWRAGFGRR